jgi:hypothetical protein
MATPPVKLESWAQVAWERVTRKEAGELEALLAAYTRTNANVACYDGRRLR